MYCEQCGNQIDDDSKFCMYCGFKIPSVSAPASKTPQPTKTPAPATKTPQPTKTPAPVTKTWSSLRALRTLHASAYRELFERRSAASELIVEQIKFFL